MKLLKSPYINFEKNDYLCIRELYERLISDICEEKLSLSEIEKTHYGRIRELIKNTNPTIYKLNNNDKINVRHYICAEYSAEFQISLLNLDIKNLKEPILDIGCGDNGYLVKYLKSHDLEACGIDRLQNNNDIFTGCNWLEFDYGNRKWGTIISNLSFSSHFISHYFEENEINKKYAKTFLLILNSSWSLEKMKQEY